MWHSIALRSLGQKGSFCVCVFATHGPLNVAVSVVAASLVAIVSVAVSA